MASHYNKRNILFLFKKKTHLKMESLLIIYDVLTEQRFRIRSCLKILKPAIYIQLKNRLSPK